jgi:hypothetical protein
MAIWLPWYGVAAVADAPSPSMIFFSLTVGVQLSYITGMGQRRRGRPVPIYRSSNTEWLLLALIQVSMQCTIGARQFLGIHPSVITHKQGRQSQFSGHI